MRVSESMNRTTSFPVSTRRRQRSRTTSQMVTWSAGSRSKVEAMTSAVLTVRRKSVTSSGLSSTRRITIRASGWFSTIAFASFWMRTVFPARAGDAMSARCPKPMGATRSITRSAMSPDFTSKRMRRFGSTEVNSFQCRVRECCSGGAPLTAVTTSSGRFFFPRRPRPSAPSTSEPGRIRQRWMTLFGT